jgi:hypothetical protein
MERFSLKQLNEVEVDVKSSIRPKSQAGSHFGKLG